MIRRMRKDDQPQMVNGEILRNGDAVAAEAHRQTFEGEGTVVVVEMLL